MYNFLQPRTGAGRFLKLILAGLVLQVPLATAQFTQVMGTVIDPQGLPYANGTIFPNLIISGSPRFTSSGFPYVPPSQPTALDAHGSFVMSIADVTGLTPSGGVWSFTVNCGAGCIPPSAGAGPVTFTTTGLIISGTVQDISSVLQLAAPPLTGGPGGGVGLTPGSSGQFLVFTTPNTATGTPALTTTGSAITATVPITVPTVNVANSVVLGTTPGLITSTGSASCTGTPGFGFLVGTPAVCGSTASAPRQVVGLQVNGSNVTSNTAVVNFNATTPAAPVNGRNISFLFTSPNLSAALVGDGVSKNCFTGTGAFSACDQGFTCTVVNDIPLSTTPATFCAVLLAVKTYTVHCAFMYSLSPSGGSIEAGFDVDVAPTNQAPNFNALLTFAAGLTNVSFGTMLQSRIFQVGQNVMLSYQVTPQSAGASFFATLDGVIVVPAPTHFDVFTAFDTGTSSSIISGSYCRLQP